MWNILRNVCLMQGKAIGISDVGLLWLLCWKRMHNKRYDARQCFYSSAIVMVVHSVQFRPRWKTKIHICNAWLDTSLFLNALGLFSELLDCCRRSKISLCKMYLIYFEPLYKANSPIFWPMGPIQNYVCMSKIIISVWTGLYYWLIVEVVNSLN